MWVVYTTGNSIAWAFTATYIHNLTQARYAAPSNCRLHDFNMAESLGSHLSLLSIALLINCISESVINGQSAGE